MGQPHSHNFVDLTGRRFGRLLVIKRAVDSKDHAKWLCQCDCGTKKVIVGNSLRTGNTSSCGCFHIERKPFFNRTHGSSTTRLYSIWCNMHTRCKNPKADRFNSYGGRGISVCKKWQRFEAFQKWALTHGYQDDLTIDRKNNDGNYTPSNCQWLTLSQNSAKRARDRFNKAKLNRRSASSGDRQARCAS